MMVVISGLMIPAWPALTKLTCQNQAAALNYVRHGARGDPGLGVGQSAARISGLSQSEARIAGLSQSDAWTVSGIEAVPIVILGPGLDLLEFKISLGIYRLKEKSFIGP